MRNYRVKISCIPVEESKKKLLKLAVSDQEDLKDTAPASSGENGTSPNQDGGESNSAHPPPQPGEPETTPSTEGATAAATAQQPPLADLLVPLSEPVPDSWTTIANNYFCITTFIIPILAHEETEEEKFSIGSGRIRLMLVDGTVSRRGALNVISQFQNKRHSDKDEGYWVDVKAIRLEPEPSARFLMGGRAITGSIQMQLQPGLARLMSRRRKT